MVGIHRLSKVDDFGIYQLILGFLKASVFFVLLFLSLTSFHNIVY